MLYTKKGIQQKGRQTQELKSKMSQNETPRAPRAHREHPCPPEWSY